MNTSWMNHYTKKFADENLETDTQIKFDYNEMKKSCEDIINELNKSFEKNQSNCRAIYNNEKNEFVFPDNVKLCFEYLNNDTVIKFKGFYNGECRDEFEITINPQNNKYRYYNENFDSLYKLMNKILSEILK